MNNSVTVGLTLLLQRISAIIKSNTIIIFHLLKAFESFKYFKAAVSPLFINN